MVSSASLPESKFSAGFSRGERKKGWCQETKWQQTLKLMKKCFTKNPLMRKEGGACDERQAEVGRLEAGGQGGRD